MSKAQETRAFILGKAFELVYKQGFQATSIDVIIATTQLTKGAFFYHFKTKEDMGLAMIKEVMAPGMHQAFVVPLINSDEPAKEIYEMMKTVLLNNPLFDTRYGCPAINLVEEMAPLNEAFKDALMSLALQWQEAIQKSIQRGKQAGNIRQDVSAKQVALFVSAGYGGVRNMGKIFGVQCYHNYLKELKNYLTALT